MFAKKVSMAIFIYLLMPSTSAKYTFSVTKKSCAVGYYSFGHEVGHNIGLMHNPATGANKYYPYGTGHLIAAGSAKTGKDFFFNYLLFCKFFSDVKIKKMLRTSTGFPSQGTEQSWHTMLMATQPGSTTTQTPM